MPIFRPGQPQGLLNQDLSWRTVVKIMSTNDLRNVHGRIVNHHRKLISKHPARTSHDKIASNPIKGMTLWPPDTVRPIHQQPSRPEPPCKRLAQLIERKAF